MESVHFFLLQSCRPINDPPPIIFVRKGLTEHVAYLRNLSREAFIGRLFGTFHAKSYWLICAINDEASKVEAECI